MTVADFKNEIKAQMEEVRIELLVLRAAFAIQMRRGWSAILQTDGSWAVYWPDHIAGGNIVLDESDGQRYYPDPVTALIETDKIIRCRDQEKR